jgi:hypothetical protein
MHYKRMAALFTEGKKLFAAGQNVVEGLSQNDDTSRRLAIEIAYSLQSGSYTEFSASELAKTVRLESHSIVEPLLRAHKIETLLDCGTGEGTRWLDFAYPTQHLYCLDASFHRLLYCRQNLGTVEAIAKASVIKGNMVSLPFSPGSVDAVFSCHAIEPNTERDAQLIIEQMFSTARRLVVIMEPNYRDARPEMKARMERHGYARNIWDAALAQQGYTVIAEGVFETATNPLNRTSYLIACRDRTPPMPESVYSSSVNQSPLRRLDDLWLDANDCMAFPILNGINCFAPEDAVFVGCQPRG